MCSHSNNYCPENTSRHIKTCPYFQSCVSGNPCAPHTHVPVHVCTRFCSSISAVCNAMTLKPAVYAMLVLVCANWPSSSTHPADAHTKPRKKKKKKAKQTKTSPRWQPVSFTANTRHVYTHRVFGEMLVDGLVLQVVVIQMVLRHAHSSNMASPHPDCSLQINRRTDPRCAVRERWWTTRAAAERIGGLLIDITCDWLRGLIDRRRETQLQEGRKTSTVQGRNNTGAGGGGLPRTERPTRLTLALEKTVKHH